MISLLRLGTVFLLICSSACFAREIALVLQVFRLCRTVLDASHQPQKTYNVTALQCDVVTCMYFCTAETLHTLILVRRFHPYRPSPNGHPGLDPVDIANHLKQMIQN